MCHRHTCTAKIRQTTLKQKKMKPYGFMKRDTGLETHGNNNYTHKQKWEQCKFLSTIGKGKHVTNSMKGREVENELLLV